ncbi:NAD-dependent epimerase/dehydratase family protein [Streptomyces sp. 4N509B]|uniref:NAD-dependent epimerase/dehydratase family protein n=1 Tax=Streptomyces sp. 4N509B TaxID=3457413 RepID=UPI003FD10187
MPTTAPRRAVVTGAAGFIGTHLTRALLASGTRVIAVDRHPMPPMPPAPNLVPVAADLNVCPLEPLLLDADVIFHLAAIPGVRPSWGPDFQAYLAANLHTTHRLMTAAAHTGVPRLVLASSSSVYGHTDGTPSSESNPPRPASPYAVTKLAAEHLCLAHSTRPRYPTSVVALRYFTVYGPGQRPDMLIQRALAAVLTGSPLQVYGDGSQRRDFTYVDDVVRATLAAADAPATNTIINVGSGTPTTIRDVLDTVSQLTGHHLPATSTHPHPGDTPTTHADVTRARDLLDWTPTTPLHTGIAHQWRHLTALRPIDRGSRASR